MQFFHGLQKKIRVPACLGIFFIMLGIVQFIANAQVYEMTLNQRRCYDQIKVEVWVKSLNASSPKLGSASLVVQYNSDYLSPSSLQSLSATDSISSIINQSNPVVSITSPFHLANGYNSLNSQMYTTGYYSLEVTHATLGTLGFQPSTEGKGSFVGVLTFDIIDTSNQSALTGIQWSSSTFPGDIRVFDADSNDIESQITFTNPGDFSLFGISILSPKFSSQVLDRDEQYACLAYVGYPVYFERSVALAASTVALNDNNAYKFSYSADNGNTWTEFGRVAETDKGSAAVSSDAKYMNGEISTAGAYVITSQNGLQLNSSNLRKPLRIVWAESKYFTNRSEQAKLQICKLAGTINETIASRATNDIFSVSENAFILGRLFFAQLDGVSQYFKTENNFNNSTQLTIEAWVNLNSNKGTGNEVGIISSSAGPNGTVINGSNEGAWMLYLQNGVYPAFRVREILDRGPNEYLASLIAYDPINVVDATAPLSEAHKKNWVHIAATVKNNEAILYVNGEIAGKYTNNYATDIRMLTTNHPLWIGVNPNGTIDANRYLNAGVKGVQVWRTALTQEQIRQRAGGIVEPSNVTAYGDLRRGLQMFYTLEGTRSDLATDASYQNSSEIIDFYNSGTISNPMIKYRPDQPHIKITSPSEGAGVSNKQNDLFQVRWLAYGIGDITKSSSKDIEIEYSLDSGSVWNIAKNSSNTDLGGTTAPDVEATYANWQPYNNNNPGANLQDLSQYARTAQMRVRGTSTNSQADLSDVSNTFTIARYFALSKREGSEIFLAGDKGMNLTSNTAFIEAWVRPYRFPTETESYFPIITKLDKATGNLHYELSLMANGQLKFSLLDTNNYLYEALSDVSLPLVRPNSVALDSPWTHVGVYLIMKNSLNISEIRFYIDGMVQSSATFTQQFGKLVAVNQLNTYPTYIGYSPAYSATRYEYDEATSAFTEQTTAFTEKGFVGELREMRFWNGTPNNVAYTGTEPTELTYFVQGAASVRANELSTAFNKNLFLSFSMNGNSFINNGELRTIPSSNLTSVTANHYGTAVKYAAVKPYIKLVEPAFREAYPNSKTDMRVRWMGFDYDGMGFSVGSSSSNPSSLEFSIRGGGGKEVQPYQYLAGRYWSGNTTEAMSLPDSSKFNFKGNGNTVYYASKVNVSIADPDVDNSGIFKQGPLSASLTNTRLRLTGKYTLNGIAYPIQSEGPLFTITPASNFTVRVLLEGHHKGTSGGSIQNIASTYANGGLKIKLYRDNSGAIGDLLDSAESASGYEERNPASRGSATSKFANVNFIFTNLTDDDYWVLVDKINYLPIMSRYAAPFVYTGDDNTTLAIESGWEFESWNGTDNNIMTDPTDNPWAKYLYTAYGSAVNTSTKTGYSTTGLVYNLGNFGSGNALPAMVAGDIEKDREINAADRVKVRKDNGTLNLVRSDVTGDGWTNADDRTIVDRNYGKVSSVWDVTYPAALLMKRNNPFEVVSELDPSLSQYFNDNAKRVNYRTSMSPTSKIVYPDMLGTNHYIVSAVPSLDGDYVDLSIYIKNQGDEFALANCTFAVEYNPNILKYISLENKDSVVFNNKPLLGYSSLNSAPSDTVSCPLAGVRTVEIDYDAFANLEGVQVPYTNTLVGTLRFKLLNRSGSVAFKWQGSTSIHKTENNSNITDDGVFQVIPSLLLYSAGLINPNGGESYSQGKNVNVQWSTTGTALVYLEFSSNSGANWTRINDSAISVSNAMYAWTTPVVSSSYCLIRLVDADSGTELDRSDSVFALVSDFAMINRPSSADPVYVGGGSDIINWVSYGYEKIHFEFSSDGVTWQTLTQQLDPSKGKNSWSIPRITTKTAYIRMLDDESSEEVARSGKFKILNGTVTFRYPRAGEVYLPGSQATVRWISNSVDEFDLQVSLNSGGSWTTISQNQLASQGMFNWTVSDYVTNNALFRAIWNAEPEMEYGRSSEFEIITEVEDDILFGYMAGKVYPNPTKGNFGIIIELPRDEAIDIEIYNSLAQKVYCESNKQMPTGSNLINIKIDKLPAGVYSMHIKNQWFNVVRKINVIN